MKILVYDVVCIGSAVVDRFLTVDEGIQNIKSGDKILVKHCEKHTGGGATNSAAALAKLGLKVRILSKLGDDHDAHFINTQLKKYKVKNICRNTSPKKTNSSTIISSITDKDRVIFAYKGASADLTFDDFKNRHLKARWIYLTSLMGRAWNTAIQIAQYAHNKNIPILFNPSLYIAKKGKKHLEPILKATHLIVLNKVEAKALLKTNTTHCPTLLKGLTKIGPHNAIITHGYKPTHALLGGRHYVLSGPRGKIVDTAGAGDAFAATVLGAIIKKYSYEDALRMGMANAQSVIKHLGTKHKLLTIKELLPKLRKYKVVS